MSWRAYPVIKAVTSVGPHEKHPVSGLPGLARKVLGTIGTLFSFAFLSPEVPTGRTGAVVFFRNGVVQAIHPDGTVTPLSAKFATTMATPNKKTRIANLVVEKKTEINRHRIDDSIQVTDRLGRPLFTDRSGHPELIQSCERATSLSVFVLLWKDLWSVDAEHLVKIKIASGVAMIGHDPGADDSATWFVTADNVDTTIPGLRQWKVSARRKDNPPVRQWIEKGELLAVLYMTPGKSMSGTVHVYDRRTCRLLWNQKLSGPVYLLDVLDARYGVPATRPSRLAQD